MTAVALTIAGSDSGGGAGIQADLKSFSAHGVYGCSAITAVTAQNTRAVTAIHPIPPEVVRAQIDAVLSDMSVSAIKIGMLGNVETITAVAEAIAGFEGPIVLDPVMIAKSGDALLEDQAVGALIARLAPLATIITPNIPESARLTEDDEAKTDAQRMSQARLLQDMGAKAVLLKGGHAQGRICVDWLFEGDEGLALQAERINTLNTHGTGCSYAAAIAAEMAKGCSIATAVQTAHGWLHTAIARSDTLAIGQGHGPVHHFHGIWT